MTRLLASLRMTQAPSWEFFNSLLEALASVAMRNCQRRRASSQGRDLSLESLDHLHIHYFKSRPGPQTLH